MTTLPMTTTTTDMNIHPGDALIQRLEQGTATIGIVGLGYVGLPLARAVHDAGYGVIGYDVDDTKVRCLERGETYLQHLGAELTTTLAESRTHRKHCDRKND